MHDASVAVVFTAVSGQSVGAGWCLLHGADLQREDVEWSVADTGSEQTLALTWIVYEHSVRTAQ